VPNLLTSNQGLDVLPVGPAPEKKIHARLSILNMFTCQHHYAASNISSIASVGFCTVFGV
jgi:hypothetical protein